MRLPSILRQFLLQIAFWTLLCLVVELVCGVGLHWGFPYNYPAVHNWTRFVDFHSFVPKFAYFHSAAFFSHGELLPYPAPAIVAYKLFLTPQPRNGRVVVPVYEATILLVSWIMLGFFRRALVRRGLSPRYASFLLIATYLLSFPFWLEWVQGNIEFIVWTLLVLGITAFWKDRPIMAAICFGIAGAMKLFPLIFLGLLLARKQYRAFVFAVLVAVATTIASLWLVCPNIHYSWIQINAALFNFEGTYILRPVNPGFDHSLFALLKLLILPLASPAHAGKILEVYLPVVAFAGCLLFFLRIRKLPIANQVLCLGIAAVLLPPVSYEYTLIQLYAPFALFVFVVLDRARQPSGPKASRVLLIVFSLFAIIFSPLSEFIYHGQRFAGQLKALALLALWIVVLRYPFHLAGSAAEVSPSSEGGLAYSA